jgi:hypothetical protein
MNFGLLISTGSSFTQRLSYYSHICHYLFKDSKQSLFRALELSLYTSCFYSCASQTMAASSLDSDLWLLNSSNCRALLQFSLLAWPGYSGIIWGHYRANLIYFFVLIGCCSLLPDVQHLKIIVLCVCLILWTNKIC